MTIYSLYNRLKIWEIIVILRIPLKFMQSMIMSLSLYSHYIVLSISPMNQRNSALIWALVQTGDQSLWLMMPMPNLIYQESWLLIISDLAELIKWRLIKFPQLIYRLSLYSFVLSVKIRQQICHWSRSVSQVFASAILVLIYIIKDPLQQFSILIFNAKPIILNSSSIKLRVH